MQSLRPWRLARGAAVLFLVAGATGCDASHGQPSLTATAVASISTSPTPSVLASASALPSAPAGPSISSRPIVTALQDGRFVALGEWHGQSDEHRFFANVLRDPQVRALLDTVVVEFGAAPEQATIDRYVAGGDVSDADLQRVWTTTTQQSGVWDSPVYRQFYETIRGLNSDGTGHQIRVILGDPGQQAVMCGQPDLASDAPCLDRDTFMADRAAAELRVGHRVLIVAGVFHLWKPVDDRAPTVTQHLEADGFRSYVLLPFGGPMLDNPDVRKNLPSSAQIVTAGWLATISASTMRGTTTVICDHPPCETPGDVGSLRDVADGFVLVGP